MNAKDLKDFREHPEWFEATPLYGTSPAILAALPLMTVEQREGALHRLTNPPVVVQRKPIPFVLPIKGSAL